MSYRFLEHTADVKFEAVGKSLEEVFVSSAVVLFESIYGEVKVKNKIKKKIEVEGEDNVSLLYLFLEEFLYLLDAEDFIGVEVRDVKIDGYKLSAIVVGDKASNYNFTNEVKAITYSDMKVEKKVGGWVATGVFDV